MKEICILTKSLKDRGYCVAGIDTKTGEVIRLVSTADGDAIDKELLDSQKINCLDVVRVEVIRHCPILPQAENWLLDTAKPIIKMGTLSKEEVLKLHPLSTEPFIFTNDNAELTTAEIKPLKHSLEIVEVYRLKLDTSLKGDGRNHHKVIFKYKNNEYKLALTDPLLRMEDFDKLPLGKAILIISIPCHPYGEENLYHKFVVKVFVEI
jgi:hypothetical protein